MRRSRDSLGFTLVEMLVALFIFGLISASGVAVMAYAADNQDVVRSHMSRMAEFQRARALLRSDLGQAAARRVRSTDGSAARRAFVAGRAAAETPLLGFVRRGWANPDGDPRASLEYVEYRIHDSRLERATRQTLDGRVAEDPMVLLTGVRSASIRYRFRGQWISGWPGGADDLPEAIDLTLEIDHLGRVNQMFLLPAVTR